MVQYLKEFELGLTNGSIKRILYKYWSVDSALRFLGNHKIMFSTYNEFNDPFECCAYVDTKNTKEEWRQYFQGQGLSPYGVKQWTDKMVKNPGEARRIVNQAIDTKKKENGIFCMTTDNQNLLMWSHYADQHKGVCLEFDISKDLESFYFPAKVNYSANYMSYNYLREPDKATEALFQKSSEWSYEQEYRILKLREHGLKVIKEEALTGITFGCRCTPEDINKIRVAAKEYPNVKFYKARPNNRNYKLDITIIP